MIDRSASIFTISLNCKREEEEEKNLRCNLGMSTTTLLFKTDVCRRWCVRSSYRLFFFLILFIAPGIIFPYAHFFFVFLWEYRIKYKYVCNIKKKRPRFHLFIPLMAGRRNVTRVPDQTFSSFIFFLFFFVIITSVGGRWQHEKDIFLLLFFSSLILWLSQSRQIQSMYTYFRTVYLFIDFYLSPLGSSLSVENGWQKSVREQI